MPGIVVTIDGPAGAGKSTVARLLAQRLGYRLLDTGAIYRAVAVKAIEGGASLDDVPALAALAAALDIDFAFEGDVNHVQVGGVDVTAAIRTPEASQAASKVSRHREVRTALLGLQRKLGGQGGVVVEGRDTGTVVFPRAEAKFFLVASDAIRAQRRQADLVAAGGEPPPLAQTLAEIRERDERDASRDVAPMIAASDAITIDSSTLTLPEVVTQIEMFVRDRM